MTTTTDRPRRTVLRAARLFDGTSSVLLPDPMVILDGPTIIAVDHAAASVPADADVVDLPGTTLLPGLVDPHVHLAFDAGPDPVATLAGRDDDAVLAAMADAARTALRGGVTTVRDLGDRDYLSLRLRGRPGLPTILAAGPPITTVGGHCHFLGGGTGSGERAVRAAVRQRVDRGCDVIKIMASGGSMTPGSRQEDGQFDLAELRAAVDEAHRHGLPITAHAHGTDAIAASVEAGVDSMEHVTFWSADSVDHRPDLIRAIADRRIVVSATLGRVPTVATIRPGFDTRWPLLITNLRELYEAGAPIVVGTDGGVGPAKPHDVLRHAPVALQQLVGMDPAEALRTITSVAADVCGLGDRKGRIAPGHDADLLAVDGDPPTDPEALHRICTVILGGTPIR